MFKGSRLFLLLLAASIVSSADAKIYKWVDEQGNTHFSDKPPKNKNIKATEQSLDNMNVTNMPRPVKTNPLTDSECQKAVDNFNNSYQNHRKKIEQQLENKSINDVQFADKLTELEQLKKQITLENCGKADPKLNTLLHCMAKNPNTQVCS
ncbi:DUF4124 domain-containing protein [Kangiella sediminilitoris]|uniref:DUF4124 domain-containing protein n=1 Tax=Kangiella sediminilitoris TaxID=1144748 RepID=A0A1B3B8T2_9GAMM|nr:DUF4124 domain-containing protein [Kangiella sediminilitoris]AOE49156.1 hypothetical protein KS2013_432 [Kangiella sediminilitoris]